MQCARHSATASRKVRRLVERLELDEGTELIGGSRVQADQFTVVVNGWLETAVDQCRERELGHALGNVIIYKADTVLTIAVRAHARRRVPAR